MRMMSQHCTHAPPWFAAMASKAVAELLAQRRGAALLRGSEPAPARALAAARALNERLTHQMRARGLPEPALAARAAAVWSAAGIYALFFQVQARRKTRSRTMMLLLVSLRIHMR